MTITKASEIIRANLPAQLLDNLELCEMTKSELIAEIEAFKNSLTGWLKGDGLPSLPAALAMARTFGVSLDLFCTGKD